MVILWLAFLGATGVTAALVVLVLAFTAGRRPSGAALLRWAWPLWIANFVLDLVILYLAMPALTGPYGGWQWLLWPLLLTGALAAFGGGLGQVATTFETLAGQINGQQGFSGLRNSAGGPKRSGFSRGRVVGDRPTPFLAGSASAGATAIGVVLVVALLFNGVIAVATTWFDGNAKALAAIPNIVPEKSDQPLPPTDVTHIVLVTKGVAAYLGQQALAGNGLNLGSTYHTDRGEYTLQSVGGHLYYLAPLIYNNVWANLAHWESPGFVVVDAEDPNAVPQLRTGDRYHMRYLPDALFNQEVVRHVYLSGYTNGNLADPTLEVDDSWHPYFTISLMQPTRGFTGDVVRRVLLVDAQTGSIGDYAPDRVPAWVDRIIPAETVDQYLTWWGHYFNAPWFNPSGSNQQQPATSMPELVYNQVDQPVWLEPMTSSAATDNSSTGVVLYDTRDRAGRFYPLTGLGVTDNVQMTFQGNPKNIRVYKVGNVQLYQIYGEPTWVATFVQDNTFGQSFQAVGIVDARHLSGANVIMEPTKTQALAAYTQWLADQNIHAPGVTPSGQTATVEGRVTRINAATELGTTVYSFLIEGQSRIFKAGLNLSPKLPLVQPGDQVRVTYLDTGQSVVTLTSFDDISIPVAAATPSPAASATATP